MDHGRTRLIDPPLVEHVTDRFRVLEDIGIASRRNLSAQKCHNYKTAPFPLALLSLYCVTHLKFHTHPTFHQRDTIPLTTKQIITPHRTPYPPGQIPKMATSRLFTPLPVGKTHLSQRIAMAPLTRYRATTDHTPTDLQTTYYAQRASVPGTLLITEATFITLHAGGYANVPGIYTPEHIANWRKVTDAVHAKGSYIFLQLWNLGRAARADVAAREGWTIKSPSAVPVDDKAPVPQEMTLAEIQQTIQDYATAAKNAIEAGFDGVEIHGANGYLVDQFIQDVTNKRTDAYGGSVENRSRFAVEVVNAVVAAVGAERTAIRLSPWSRFLNMRMADPVTQFSDVLRKISGHNLAYVHFVQAGIVGNADAERPRDEGLGWALDIWKGPVLIAGGLDAEGARRLVEEEYKERNNVVAVCGRYFIANPDLPFRVKEGIDLTPFDEKLFYNRGEARGYITWPFSKEFEAKFGPQGVQAHL
ncbi:hypothetical protein QBC34DRAFT_402648 [Podospora aff. communis PSN243]|uniref:NADH:flavin oxidoreductase/NADH oxidase N-terminal domain-containing protein n=1 Tax=Podospora aff. communis PSN243 TaxID=3040156 RepID=A0AAV9GPR3_9PEZI|nr:hypothetical protein QBC34DRAFT_402648 [Podospora aff. communis PSN243]